MKLLLSLILIIAIAGSLINSMPIKESDCVSVISSLSGYNTNFKAVSFNGVFENGGQQSQSSFFEQGSISLDFKDQQMMVEFQVSIENQQVVNGQTFIFVQNKTQYVIINNECYSYPFETNFPSSIGLVKVGDSSIGSIDVEVLAPQTQSPLSNQQVYVDSKFCSPLSLEFINTPNETPGYTLLNFYNYESTFAPFVLPNQCLSSSQVVNIRSTSAKSHKSYPKFLNHLL